MMSEIGAVFKGGCVIYRVGKGTYYSRDRSAPCSSHSWLILALQSKFQTIFLAVQLVSPYRWLRPHTHPLSLFLTCHFLCSF